MEPIRLQESRYILDDTTTSLPIVRCAYIVLTVLALFFQWHQIVTHHSLVVYHGISHLPLVLSHLRAGVYIEKIQAVARGILAPLNPSGETLYR